MESGVTVETFKRSKQIHSSYCAAANCNNSRSKRPDLSFFTFPKDPDRLVLVLRTVIGANLSNGYGKG